ncbi:histidine kinase [Paenibacillus sp. LHD-117]|uniref:sensor histidine kinase n=1 Tax=Paenibacillus sp. LHD-117 TaxID=3071412 RepID=UPI0027DF2FF8|nr:histidine kinase [Paenibacillus sp. LHD-117]MDQ6420176.1 histidine kinase [Paenibacillus sp. LHD-117]
MSRRTRLFSTASLKFKLMIGVLALTLPLIAILIYTNSYAANVVRNQVADSYQKMMGLYINLIDRGLEDVDRYINSMSGTSMEILALDQAVTEDDYYKAKINLYQKMNNDIVIYNSIDSFFVYTPKWNEIFQIYNFLSYEESLLVQNEIVDASHNLESAGYDTNSWKVHKIGESYYLMHVVKSGNVFFGAWVKMENLMIPLNLIQFGPDGGALFATSDGKAITDTSFLNESSVDLVVKKNHYLLSGSDKKYLVVGESSKRGDFNLVALVPDHEILEKLPYFQKLFSFIPVVSLLLALGGLVILRKIILVPLNRLIFAMKRIRDGNWSIRIESETVADELKIVHDTFNGMMEEINELRVNVYEEQLMKQKEELQRLQLQINPHFFLNALNIIYHLAKSKDYVLIKEMSQSLIRHFRFMFRTNTAFVQVKEEVEHTINYLHIQELRFPDSLSSEIKVPDYVHKVLIPPLFIQTFVENTIKHAVTLDTPIHITIEADIVEHDFAPYLQVLIADSGRGFDEAVLSQLRDGELLTNEQGEHVGIWNVQRRMKLLYKDKGYLEFRNAVDQGGAVVLMRIPIQTTGSEGD